MNRRVKQVALTVVVGIIVVTAGCNGILASTETELLLVNNDEQSHETTVEILQDGDVVYSENVSATANTNTDLPTFEGSGEYTVTVTVDGTTTEATHEFTDDEQTLSVGIQNDESVIIGG